jgi:hypothetical protein
MPIVGKDEALDRVMNFFHSVLPTLPPGHSINKLNCWTCKTAASAVLTPISKQKAMSW